MKYRIQVWKPQGSDTIDKVMFKGFQVETTLDKNVLLNILTPLIKSNYRLFIYEGAGKASKYTKVTLEELITELPKVRFYGEVLNYITTEDWEELGTFKVHDRLLFNIWNSKDKPEYRLRTFIKFSTSIEEFKPNITAIQKLLPIESTICKADEDTIWMFGECDIIQVDTDFEYSIYALITKVSKQIQVWKKVEL